MAVLVSPGIFLTVNMLILFKASFQILLTERWEIRSKPTAEERQ